LRGRRRFDWLARELPNVLSSAAAMARLAEPNNIQTACRSGSGGIA
jgi:hypothetical protein